MTTSETGSNVEQAEFWDTMAPTWIDIEERIEVTAAEPGRLAMEALHLQPGQDIVDLGCGTGATTVELAARVGPDGRAVGADISTGMLERARERATSTATTNVEFVHADVQAADLGEARFDAAFSRFGVMFYADPVAAFTNIRRSLRPGGRLAFACWQSIFTNDWMLVPGMAVMSVTNTPPAMPESGQPGPFSLADPDHVRSVLGAAGFSDVTATEHNDTLVISETTIPEYAATSLRIGAAREALKDADEDTHRRALAAVEEALRARVEGGEVHAARGFLVVSAST